MAIARQTSTPPPRALGKSPHSMVTLPLACGDYRHVSEQYGDDQISNHMQAMFSCG